jgi:hypothetical protein
VQGATRKAASWAGAGVSRKFRYRDYMEVLSRVRAPSGVELDVVSGAELRPWRRSKYPATKFGETWIPPVSVLDRELRAFDQPALRILERDGASDARSLAQALARTKRFRSELLGTDMRTEIASAWIDFADRRLLVQPFADDDPRAGDARWNTTSHGREQIKRLSAFSLLPKAISQISAAVGLAAVLVGGAAAVNHALAKSTDVLAGIGIAVVLLGVFGLLARPRFLAMRPLRAAALEILWCNGLLHLPRPREPARTVTSNADPMVLLRQE